MKTAVSLPDALFEDVDEHARRTGRSRSEVYAAALQEYLARHDEDRVTSALDAVYADVDSTLDAGLLRAARRTLARDVW